jgi:hypothetical protein
MHRWQDNIITDIKGTAHENVKWIHLAQNRNEWQTFLSMVMIIQSSMMSSELLNKLRDYYLLKNDWLCSTELVSRMNMGRSAAN